MKQAQTSGRRTATLVAVLACALPLSPAPALTIVSNRQPRAVIVTPAGRVWGKQTALIMAESQAAACLNGHIRQMSGADVPTVDEMALGPARVVDGRIIPATGKVSAPIFILVGEGDLAAQLGVTSDELKPGGIRIRTCTNAVVLVGHPRQSHPLADGGGIRRTTAVFLERLGCRYLWPGESGKVVPQRDTIVVPDIDLSYSPPIAQRHIRMMGMSDRPQVGLQRLGIPIEEWREAVARARHTAVAGLAPKPRHTPADLGWTQWHGLGGSLWVVGGHSGCGLNGGWEEHGDDHPEWFALQADGTRDQAKAGGRWRLCLSNPDLVDHVANAIIRDIDPAQGTACVSLSPNDGGYSSFCMCEGCRKLDPTEAPPVTLTIFEKVGESARHTLEAPSLTDRYVHYWNAVAERVTEVHPEALFTIDAYSAYSLPPVREKLHPNLFVRYVPSSTNGWSGWQAAGASRIFWRPNILLAGRRTGKLHVMTRKLADTMAFMAEHGCLATDFDSIVHNWAVHGLNYYAAARLNWEPFLPADDILDQYCSPGFGPGADRVKQYFLVVQEVTDDPGRTFDRSVVAQLRALLNAADLAAANDGATRNRIRFLRLGLNFTDLQCTLDRMVPLATARDPAYDPERARRLLTLNYIAFQDLARNHNTAVHPYLLWANGDYANWAPIGGRAFRPAQELLDTRGRAPFTLTGAEDSFEEMMMSLGIPDAGIPQAGDPAAEQPAAVAEVDEDGNVREMPAP